MKEIEEAPVIAYNDEPDEEDADFEMDDEMEEVAEPDELEAEIDEPEEVRAIHPPQKVERTACPHTG